MVQAIIVPSYELAVPLPLSVSSRSLLPEPSVSHHEYALCCAGYFHAGVFNGSGQIRLVAGESEFMARQAAKSGPQRQEAQNHVRPTRCSSSCLAQWPCCICVEGTIVVVTSLVCTALNSPTLLDCPVDQLPDRLVGTHRDIIDGASERNVLAKVYSSGVLGTAILRHLSDYDARPNRRVDVNGQPAGCR